MDEEELDDFFLRIPDQILKDFHELTNESLAEVLKTENRFAVLSESGEVIPAATLEEWANFMNSPQRNILRHEFGEYLVSTVFLGLNHQFFPKRPPFWFETMVFGPGKEKEILGEKTIIQPNLWQKRATTKAEALATHYEGINWLKVYHLSPSQ